MRLKRGDDPKIRATMEDEILLHDAGSAETLELEDTNMFQTDSRDRAADRDAEAYENQKYFRTGEQITADDELFRENPRLVKLRQGSWDIWVLRLVQCSSVQPDRLFGITMNRSIR